MREHDLGLAALNLKSVVGSLGKLHDLFLHIYHDNDATAIKYTH